MGQRLRPEAVLRRRGPQRPEERHWVQSTGRADLEQSQSGRQSPLGGEGPPSPPSLYFWSSLSCSPASRASSQAFQAAERPMAGQCWREWVGVEVLRSVVMEHVLSWGSQFCQYHSISPWPRWDPGLGSHSGPQPWSVLPAPGIFHSSRPPGSVVQPGSSPCVVIAKYLSAQPLPRPVNISGQGCGLFIRGPSAPARGSAQ